MALDRVTTRREVVERVAVRGQYLADAGHLGPIQVDHGEVVLDRSRALDGRPGLEAQRESIRKLVLA